MNRTPLRRIGVLTGGGDCPGLNAVIRVVTKAAILKLGIDVLGIEEGFLGLIEDRVRPLRYDDVSNILTAGGTILGTNNRANPASFVTGYGADGTPIRADVTDRVLATVERHAIDLLVCVGGDGTMSAANGIIRRGVPCVGVPKTIDNDLMHCELTFGFTTAVQTASECLDKIRTTGASHHRIMVVELMGRNAGWLTLHAGLASGADVILIPEIPYDLDSVCDFCIRRAEAGRRFTLIAVSEGARPRGGQQVVDRIIVESPEPIRLGGIAQKLAADIETRIRRETRATILGHVQRGGAPVAFDRVLATLLGHKAIQMAALGEWNQVAVWRQGRTDMAPIAAVADQQRLVELDDPLIAVARALGACLGD
ncbi:MAG: ATP-dependent 6-phosphofructokinase [Phycisphaerae bacterium]|nr:ATP-dependent 6-phosphofructokinase [Phycisphaerae bacterium]MCZ2398509.1 ATP-dependent 6-phosphofructokinase [Phycisphaerae bacterium]NUQ50429.1 ATP-dependent 6-phosphofructokinase [Phycisphaerae bacterium]